MGTSALPYELSLLFACQAKAAIDNCRAGRAAKGATLVTCSKIKVGRLVRPTFILALDNEGESNSEGEFCVKKTVNNRF